MREGWEASLVAHPILWEPRSTVVRVAPSQRHLVHTLQLIYNFLEATFKKKSKKKQLKLILIISCFNPVFKGYHVNTLSIGKIMYNIRNKVFRILCVFNMPSSPPMSRDHFCAHQAHGAVALGRSGFALRSLTLRAQALLMCLLLCICLWHQFRYRPLSFTSFVCGVCDNHGL